MTEHDDASAEQYPIGRGYGHDYMRGGEVLGGYGYSAREEYERRRGELMRAAGAGDGAAAGDGGAPLDGSSDGIDSSGSA
jgi:hypothetical protein